MLDMVVYNACVFSIVAGYARIVLAIVAFLFMPTNYIIASWCYIISAFLDVFDGYFARKFNQGTAGVQIFFIGIQLCTAFA